MINYTLIRSARKTISIHITKEATVEVRAPYKVKKSEIDRFVSSKYGWIEKHLSRQIKRVENKEAFTLDYGGSLLFMGKPHTITAVEGNKAGFLNGSFIIPPGLPPGEIKQIAIKAYRLAAKQFIPEKTTYYSKLMKVTPVAVKINGAKTRWGSCSGKNSLNFSWRIMMAGEETIDYVIVHELAHIREHNHSARFWAAVYEILSDYKERHHKLTELQKRLANENWE